MNAKKAAENDESESPEPDENEEEGKDSSKLEIIDDAILAAFNYDKEKEKNALLGKKSSDDSVSDSYDSEEEKETVMDLPGC